MDFSPWTMALDVTTSDLPCFYTSLL